MSTVALAEARTHSLCHLACQNLLHGHVGLSVQQKQHQLSLWCCFHCRRSESVNDTGSKSRRDETHSHAQHWCQRSLQSTFAQCRQSPASQPSAHPEHCRRERADRVSSCWREPASGHPLREAAVASDERGAACRSGIAAQNLCASGEGGL